MASIRSVVLAGGGTAGHVNPLLAVADELSRRGVDTVTALGVSGGLEDDLVPAQGYPLRHIPKVPMPRRPSGAWLSLGPRLREAIAAAGEVMDSTKAQVVVGFGGYVATPAYFAAHRRGIPIVIHEQNVRPGLANRLGARWAQHVAVTFANTPLRDGVVTGLPLRRDLSELVASRKVSADQARQRAAAELGIDPAMPTLVVTGGSLGAMTINHAFAGAADQLTEAGIQVLHLTGKGKSAELLSASTGIAGQYRVLEYLPQMHWAYAVADLVVCRSGAGTVCELTALGIPAIYVPLPIGNGEQRLNARPAVDAGGGLLVEDADFTSDWVTSHIIPLVTDVPKLARMADGAASVGIIDGAQRVADLILPAMEVS